MLFGKILDLKGENLVNFAKFAHKGDLFGALRFKTSNCGLFGCSRKLLRQSQKVSYFLQFQSILNVRDRCVYSGKLCCFQCEWFSFWPSFMFGASDCSVGKNFGGSLC